MIEELALKVGLTKCGKDEDGEDEWIGTDAQWRAYRKLEDPFTEGDKLFDQERDNQLSD